MRWVLAFLRRIVCAAALAVLAFAPASSRAGDDPDFIHFGAGWYDFQRPQTHTAEFDIAYRSDYKLWFLKPHGGLLATADGQFYGYGGFLFDLYFGNRFVVTGSTAVGLWAQGASKKNLGHVVEFRSGLDFGYRFDDRSRLALGIYHISNTGLWAKHNPGEETALLSYQVPINKLFPSWKSPGGNSADYNAEKASRGQSPAFKAAASGSAQPAVYEPVSSQPLR
jgi:lipid A 3-O-deacylase